LARESGDSDFGMMVLRVIPLLHLPVILLNQVVQVFIGTDERLSGQDALGLQFGDG
jgi:hypothetical protein